jgi:flagellar biogenesis protein FliO
MWMIVAILLSLWLYGLISDLFGNMIHLLLIVALMALVFLRLIEQVKSDRPEFESTRS